MKDHQISLGDFGQTINTNTNTNTNNISFNTSEFFNDEISEISETSKSTKIQKYKNPEIKIGWDTPFPKKETVFTGKDTVNIIVKLIENSYHSFGGWYNSLEKILEVILFALLKQEHKYMEAIKGMNPIALNVTSQISGILIQKFCYDYEIYDYLGDVYMQIGSLSKSKAIGQYFTPFNVCQMMASMQMPGNLKKYIAKVKSGEIKRARVIDPCVGSGAMLLAHKKIVCESVGMAGLKYYSYYGQDIDRTCVNMCKIQMLLTDYDYMASLLYVTAYEIYEKLNKHKQGSDKTMVMKNE